MEIGTIVEREIDSGRRGLPFHLSDRETGAGPFQGGAGSFPGRRRPQIGDRWYGADCLEVIAVQDCPTDAFGRGVWHVTFRVVDPAH